MSDFSFKKWTREADGLFSLLREAPNCFEHRLEANDINYSLSDATHVVKLRYGLISNYPVANTIKKMIVRKNVEKNLKTLFSKCNDHSASSKECSELMNALKLKQTIFNKYKGHICYVMNSNPNDIIEKAIDIDLELGNTSPNMRGDRVLDAMMGVYGYENLFKEDLTSVRRSKSFDFKETVLKLIDCHDYVDVLSEFQCGFINSVTVTRRCDGKYVCETGPFSDYYMDEQLEETSDQVMVKFYLSNTKLSSNERVTKEDIDSFREPFNACMRRLMLFLDDDAKLEDRDNANFTFRQLKDVNIYFYVLGLKMIRRGEHLVSKELNEWKNDLCEAGFSDYPILSILSFFAFQKDSKTILEPRDALLVKDGKKLTFHARLFSAYDDIAQCLLNQVNSTPRHGSNKGTCFEEEIKQQWSQFHQLKQQYQFELNNNKQRYTCDMLLLFDNTILICELKNRIQPFYPFQKLKIVLEILLSDVSQVNRLWKQCESEVSIEKICREFSLEAASFPKNIKKFILCSWNLGRSLIVDDICIVSEIYARNYFLRNPGCMTIISPSHNKVITKPFDLGEDWREWQCGQHYTFNISDFERWVQELPQIQASSKYEHFYSTLNGGYNRDS